MTAKTQEPRSFAKLAKAQAAAVAAAPKTPLAAATVHNPKLGASVGVNVKRTKVDPATTEEAKLYQAKTLAAPAAAKRRNEEAAAKAANAEKLAKAVKTVAPAKTLAVGSGALIGVAQGATEGQPHTKRAVQQAVAKARAAARDESVAVLAKLDAEAVAAPTFVMGVDHKTAKAAKAKRAAVRASVEFAAAQKAEAAATRADPAKADAKKVAKAAKAPRVAKAPATVQAITIVDKAYSFGAEGTARRASWDACKLAKTTAEYAAKGGKAKYLSRWVAAKAIKLA